MANVKYVSTREDLKSALALKYDYVAVTDKKLAESISRIKSVSETILAGVIVTVGLAVANIWNPIGWLSGAAVAATAGPVAYAVSFLILVLGAGVIWALYNEWTIVARGKITLPDGTTVDAEIILSPK